jgi:hypothetical protein
MGPTTRHLFVIGRILIVAVVATTVVALVVNLSWFDEALHTAYHPPALPDTCSVSIGHADQGA